MSISEEVYTKLKNDLHSDDYQFIMKGYRKTITDKVIEDCINSGDTEVNYIANRVKDRFGLGFDPSNNIMDKVYYELERLLDYESDMKYVSARKIFNNEKDTIKDMEGEKPYKIAKQLIGQYRYKLRNNMKLKEAKQILHKNGFMLEGSMSLEDKIDNAVKQTEKFGKGGLYKMRLDEAKQILNKNGFLIEDTDDWDEADMPAGMSDEDRAEMAKKHNDRRTDPEPETHNKLICREFKKRFFGDSDWYKRRMYPQGAEQLEDGKWKLHFWYNGGTFEREEYKIEIITDTNYNFLGGEIFFMDSYDYGKVIDEMPLTKRSDIQEMESKHHYSR